MEKGCTAIENNNNNFELIRVEEGEEYIIDTSVYVYIYISIYTYKYVSVYI